MSSPQLLAQTPSEMEKIERSPIVWEDMMYVQMSDYQRRVLPKGLSAPMISSFNVDMKIPFLKLMFGSKDYNKYVVCSFDPNKSWINVKVANGRDLQHEITLFLIYELSARHIRKRLTENSRLSILCGRGRRIYDEEIKYARGVILRYNEETQMGHIKLQQQNWRRRLTRELESLFNYCEKCKVMSADKKRIRENKKAVRASEKQAEQEMQAEEQGAEGSKFDKKQRKAEYKMMRKQNKRIAKQQKEVDKLLEE